MMKEKNLRLLLKILLAFLLLIVIFIFSIYLQNNSVRPENWEMPSIWWFS